MKYINLSHGLRAKVDDQDYKYLAEFRWYADPRNNGWRVRRSPIKSEIVDGKRPVILMHRVIMSPPSNMFVDHINGDALDNRRSNLRICTQTQNNRNRRLNKNSKTGYKGVILQKGSKRYRVFVAIKRKVMCIGIFDKKEDAAIRYNQWAAANYKEFARLNKIV